jgi:hypothetical protein
VLGVVESDLDGPAEAYRSMISTAGAVESVVAIDSCPAGGRLVISTYVDAGISTPWPNLHSDPA